MVMVASFTAPAPGADRDFSGCGGGRIPGCAPPAAARSRRRPATSPSPPGRWKKQQHVAGDAQEQGPLAGDGLASPPVLGESPQRERRSMARSWSWPCAPRVARTSRWRSETSASRESTTSQRSCARRSGGRCRTRAGGGVRARRNAVAVDAGNEHALRRLGLLVGGPRAGKCLRNTAANGSAAQVGLPGLAGERLVVRRHRPRIACGRARLPFRPRLGMRRNPPGLIQGEFSEERRAAGNRRSGNSAKAQGLEVEVGYQGEPGAFGEVAAAAHGGVPRGFASFEKLLEALRDGEVDEAVLPMDNAVVGPSPRRWSRSRRPWSTGWSSSRWP